MWFRDVHSDAKEKALALLEPERFPIVSNYMCNIAFDKIAMQPTAVRVNRVGQAWAKSAFN